MRVSFYNLGCKVNSYEIEAIGEDFRNKGYEIVDFKNEADIVIINTCTVTSVADQKSRQMLSRGKRNNKHAVVVAMGCFVQVLTKKDREKLDYIDIFIGNTEKDKAVEIIEKYIKENEKSFLYNEYNNKDKIDKNQNNNENFSKYGEKNNNDIDSINTSNNYNKNNKRKVQYNVENFNKNQKYENLILKGTNKHTRAYVKIQDGCNQYCAYCLIPMARGNIRSKKEHIAIEEIRELLKKGYKEIVLTGIHLSSYGREFNKTLTDFIKHVKDLEIEVEDEVGLFRIRLGSLEPRVITREFLEVLKSIKGFCPQFHLSLQSGSDKTLKNMNRHYTSKEYKEKVDLIREYFKNPAITTDIIVGFPMESEEEFKDSMEFVKNLHLAKCHVFKYSERKGTKAEGFPHKVKEDEKHKRSIEMISITDKSEEEYKKKFIGKEVEILVERIKEIEGKKYYVGYSREYIEYFLPVEEYSKDITNKIINYKVKL